MDVMKLLVVGGLTLAGAASAGALYINMGDRQEAKPVSKNSPAMNTAIQGGQMAAKPSNNSQSMNTEQADCVFDDTDPIPCTVAFENAANGETMLIFKSANEERSFSGTRQGAWWSGRIGNTPAMGYMLNRGNVIFSTDNLSTTIQYWTEGNEHGNY